MSQVTKDEDWGEDRATQLETQAQSEAAMDTIPVQATDGLREQTLMQFLCSPCEHQSKEQYAHNEHKHRAVKISLLAFTTCTNT